MRRLKFWFRRVLGPAVRRTPVVETLPFTSEEFARLIRSGRPEDMKLLAERMSLKTVSRVRVG
jgi:hypothetical protein